MRYVAKRNWVLGRDGAAHKLHHWPRFNDELESRILKTLAIVLTCLKSRYYFKRQDGLRERSSIHHIFFIVTDVQDLSPTIAFLLFGALSGAVSLFLVETMSTIHGNEVFQARVEYSTVAHLYLGDRVHITMQVLLYCALQSVNISSIIISEQVRQGPPTILH